MSVPSNTFQTFQAVGNREDLVDIIYRVQYTDTPFLSTVDKGKATAVNHEWQTQALAAPATNQQVEGDDWATNAATPTARVGNYCQIARKIARVSGTQQVVKTAGRDNDLNYQMLMRGVELKTDLEFALVGSNLAKSVGSTSTPRIVASVSSFIKTNTSKGAGGSDPAAADGTSLRTDGTQRGFTEAQFKTVLQGIWSSGGKPDMVMAGGFNKQVFSSFTGRSTQVEDPTAKKITAAVTVYESDFGTVKVVPNAIMRSRDVLVLQSDMWAAPMLRNMDTNDVAKTGDSDAKSIVCEFTLEARNEKASGGVFDLTTS